MNSFENENKRVEMIKCVGATRDELPERLRGGLRGLNEHEESNELRRIERFGTKYETTCHELVSEMKSRSNLLKRNNLTLV